MAFDDTKATFDTLTATEYNNLITFIKSTTPSSGTIGFGTPSELTISSGSVTKTASFHTIDTESDAATDDLDTISGGTTGDIIILKAADSARTVVVKNGTGNIVLPSDFDLDNANDTIVLIYDGTNWLALASSNNGA